MILWKNCTETNMVTEKKVNPNTSRYLNNSEKFMREMCLPRQQRIAGEWWRHWSSKWTILAPMDCHCPRSWWGLGLQLCYQMPNSQRWLHWRKSPWLLYNKHIVPWTSSPSLVVQPLPITKKKVVLQFSNNTLNSDTNWQYFSAWGHS